MRNRPNWPRLSYQDTNRVTVEVLLKAEAGVELAWTVIFQKSEMHEGVRSRKSTQRGYRLVLFLLSCFCFYRVSLAFTKMGVRQWLKRRNGT